jgi:hypothetical protein
MKPVSRALIVAIVALSFSSFSSCGNYSADSKRNVVEGAVGSSNPVPNPYTGTDRIVEGDYDCPVSPNVVWFGELKDTYLYDPYNDGSGYYRVCNHLTARTAILIHGKMHNQALGKLCVIPMRNGAYIFNQTGQAIFQCFPVTQTGVYATFPNVDYNEVQLREVISDNTKFSYGRIR